jgi:S1-C subfamily serine protease
MGGETADEVGYAIPVDTVQIVVNRIIRDGRVAPPTFGIHVPEERIEGSVEQQLGRIVQDVPVAKVLPSSPAEKDGLQESTIRGDGTLMIGDCIPEVGNQPLLGEPIEAKLD